MTANPARILPLLLLLLSTVGAVRADGAPVLVPAGIAGSAAGSGGAAPDLLERGLARLERRLEHYPADYEARLLRGLIHFKQGRMQQALDEIDALTRDAPRFHLAHLVHGDLQLARARTVSDVGFNPVVAAMEDDERDRDRVRDLREEASARLNAYLASLREDRLPAPLLRLGTSVATALIVDKSRNRLYVYENAGPDEPPRLLRDLYVSTGQLRGDKEVEGDLRTPEGVYFVTGFIPPERLPGKYGHGAFPLNYPNELDRHLGKTGDGIWLHGTDRVFYSRPPLDSEGCVVLPNIDLDAVAPYIRPGRTPVVIADSVDWLEVPQWQARRRTAMRAIEDWRSAWEAMATERYFGRYAAGFWSPRHDLASWRDYKRRVFAGKTEQDIDLSDLSLFAYPDGAAGGRDLLVAQFRQSYRSNNYDGDMDKRMYLAREEGDWRILYEGAQ